ncbi:MAG: hypothetical protein KTR31_16975 [Myxococcales bacterium]|nr:hypothetical protein [Myxococcales bacterium]
MDIQCENCDTGHELDPPTWVISSGRAFRFRCSACGHSQSVRPARGQAAAPATNAMVAQEGGEPVSEGGVASIIDDEPDPMAVTASMVDTIRMPGPSTLLGGEEAQQQGESSVFLKQKGQIYMVQDWDTLEDWIRERRVDPSDLVSEGGVRWEPITDRPDLAALLDEVLSLAATPVPLLPDPSTSEESEPADLPEPLPHSEMPTVADVPFVMAPEPTPVPAPTAVSWSDEDTSGVPTGLPPLPVPGMQLHPLATTPESDTAVTAVTQVTPSGLASEPTVGGPTPVPTEARIDDSSTDSEPAPLRPEPLQAEVNLAETPAPAASGQWEDLLAEDAPPVNATPEPLTTASPVVPFSFDEAWDDLDTPPPNNNGMWFGAAAVTAAILAVLGVALFGPPTAGLGTWLTPVPDGGDPEVLEASAGGPVAAPRVEPPAPEPPAPEPAPEPLAPEPAPEPAPVAVPAPAPRPVSEVIEIGWSKIDFDQQAAGKAFKEALDREPDNDDANYGYGYVLLMRADPDAATFLCRARDARDAEIRQDVVGLIASHSLSCP